LVGERALTREKHATSTIEPWQSDLRLLKTLTNGSRLSIAKLFSFSGGIWQKILAFTLGDKKITVYSLGLARPRL
jgi:hypothetical protein